MSLKIRVERLESVQSEPTVEDLENLTAEERYMRMLNGPPTKAKVKPTVAELTPEEAYQRMIGK
jgi:hypothetical protein